MHQKLKSKIETHFNFLGQKLYNNPFKILFPLFVVIGFLAFQIPSIEINTSSEKLLHSTDPNLLIYNDFRDQFGSAEFVIIMIKTKDIFTADFLKKLKVFHDELETNVPHVREVTSLINIRDVRGENDTIVIKGLLDDWFAGKSDLDTLKQRAENSEFYSNYILSEDKTTLAVIIDAEPSVPLKQPVIDLSSGFDILPPMNLESVEKHYFGAKETEAFVAVIKEIIAKYDRPDFSLKASGLPIIENAFNLLTITDIERCVILAFLAISFFLIVMFNRLSGFFFPMLIITSTLVSTIGLMALLNISIKLTTTVIPAFLLSVSVADAVHILVIFYKNFQDSHDKKKAIAFSLEHSGLPILMTSLTTAAGLLSFSFADITGLSEIGYLSAAGIGFAFLYTILMLPPLIAVFPISIKSIERQKNNKGQKLINYILERIALFTTCHPHMIIGSAGILFALSIFFLFDLKCSHTILQAFPNTSIEKQDLVAIDDKFRGSLTLELIIDTLEENGVYNPDILNRIDEFSLKIKAIKKEGISVGKVLSINHIVKEMNQVLHNGEKNAYIIPQNRETIAQELFLFENGGGSDLSKIVDNQFRKTRLTIKTPWVDAILCNAFIFEIEKQFNIVFQDKALLTITGSMALFNRVIRAAIFSMTKSYFAAFIIITVIMTFLLGDLKIGLISMIPNLMPIIIILGIMSFLKIPFDLNSLMIGSVAIGIVVDDTVHFLYNFNKNYLQKEDVHDAIRRTLLSTGRAMLITSLALSSGFFVLLSGNLKHLVNFGFFTGTIILLALAGDFLIIPALMVILPPTKRESTPNDESTVGIR